MDTKINWHRQLTKLQRYCERRGYAVVFEKLKDGISYISLDDKIIMVHNKQNIERQFYTLLHEIGHDLFCENKQYQPIKYAQNKFGAKSNVNKVSTIEEEIGAWNAARYLADKKKYKINKKNFQKFKTELLMTYIRWTVGV